MSIIVSSEIIEDRPKKGGCRSIRERHVEADGVFHDYTYQVSPATDVSVIMAARVLTLEASLIEQELTNNAMGIEEGI